MTTKTTDNKADVYSRPAARFDGDGQLEIRGVGGGQLPPRPLVRRDGLRADQPAHRGVADGPGDGQRPGAGGAAGDGAGRLGGDSRRPPGPGAGVGAGRPQPGGDGPSRRHGRHAPVRRRDGHRGQDAGAGGVQTLARPRGGAQPPGVGCPGRLLHPGDLRGAAGRGDRRDGHRQPRLGLRGGAGGAGREGPGTGLRMARRACRPPCPARARTPTRCPTGTSPPTDWQCRSCPFLNVCLPGVAAEAEAAEEPASDAEPGAPVTDEEARKALHDYEELQDTIREFEDEKRWVAARLRAWLGQQGVAKAKLEGREKTRSVVMVRTTRYSVDYRRLNKPARPGRPRRDRHRERLRVPAGQLDAPQPERTRGRFPLQRGGPALIQPGAASPRHTMQEEPQWHAPSTR